MANPGRLGELLVANKIITEQQLDAASAHSSKNKTRIGTSLVQLGHINEKVLASFLAKQYGITAISLEEVKVPANLAKLIPVSVCDKHTIAPLAIESNKLCVATCDPTNVTGIDDIRFLCNMDVKVYLATESAIKKLIDRTYRASAEVNLEKEAQDLNRMTEDTGAVEIGVRKESQQLDDGVGDPRPVIRLINKLFIEAINRKASDIHIEPYESHIRIRFRVDGSLYEIMKIPAHMRNSIPARVKVMSNLNISEKRLPQDGRIAVKLKDRQLDVRVSTLPTIFGEKVVMRLLDQGGGSPDLSKCGMEPEQLDLFRKAASQPYGMVLVTGPTGSGKSTTLYGILSELNQPDINISTVEDPVEYNMAGANQVQMKDQIGLNFAAALRSLLRQDPDIIMVGEIRDGETAEIAVKAALTGHMVLSTLHSNDAPSTISRLVHMGLEPFLITAALNLVQAQRLVRMLCPNCKEPNDKITPEELMAAECPQEWIGQFQPMMGRGCSECGNTGYRGRKGIYEVMYMTERIRNLVIKGATSDQIKEVALADKMLTLRQAALMKLFRGETTLEEVLNNSRPDGDIKTS